MADKKEETRRVSFAAEPQINIIYREEYNSTKTNSSMGDIPMDITTDLIELKDLNFLETKKNNDEIKNPYDENCDEKLEEYYNYVESFAKRCSLDPIGIKTQMEKHQKRNTLFRSEIEDNKINEDEILKNITLNDNKERIAVLNGHFNDFIKQETKEPRPSVGHAFNDTGIINSSYTVEELVNTIDLRKFIPREPINRIDISEFLTQQGIRFLDEAVVDVMKRDTLSKSKNNVDPSLELYYKYSLRERIDFLYNFSTYLIDRLEDLQLEINDAVKNIDIAEINKENLKRIRNESRNKSKIDWYGLRKIYEIQFNKKMIQNKNLIVDTFNEVRKENEQVKELNNQKKLSIEYLKSQIEMYKDKVQNYDKTKIKEVESLQVMIEERNLVLENAMVELKDAKKAIEVKNSENKQLDKEIKRLRAETDNLRKNLIIKNVTEAQLNNIKNEVLRYKTVFGIKLLNLTKSFASFDINGIIININMESFDFDISLKESDPCFEMVKSIRQLKFLSLKSLLLAVLKRYALCLSLKKEICMIKEKIKTEIFYLNGMLYLRFFLDIKSNVLDLCIDSSLNLLKDEVPLGNIESNPGLLLKFIGEKI